MARNKNKWKIAFLFHVILLNVFTRSLPIDNIQTFPNRITYNKIFPKLEVPDPDTHEISSNEEDPVIAVELDVLNKTEVEDIDIYFNDTVAGRNWVDIAMLRDVRPGQEVISYDVELTFDGGTFHGRVVIDVRLASNTIDDPMAFHVEGLNIERVLAGLFTEANAVDVNYWVDDGKLEIEPEHSAALFVVIIEYSGQISNTGLGMFQGDWRHGDFGDNSYIAMNLHPTHARRVFPCMDEPTETSRISFSFNDVPFTNIITNSMPEDGSSNEFVALQGPPHVWGMVAHNFVNINIPIQFVHLFGRSEIRNQDAQAAVAINNYFTALEEWTQKPYFEIDVNQDGRMAIIALPDTSVDWYALSTVCIWEPYIMMEINASQKQRKTALIKIAEAMARQWFGYVIFPENWSSQWVINGLGTYAAYEVAKSFQDNPVTIDITLLDMNTLFVTDVIQESLLLDSYEVSQPLEPGEDLFNDNEIRYHINGLLRYKAPAIMRMLRLILGREDDDFIQLAARALLNSRSLQTVSSLIFYDAINSHWLFSDYQIIDDVAEFLEPYVFNRGYPVVHVSLRQGGVFITQESFGFSPSPQTTFMIPLTYTTSVNPNFETENIFNIEMTDTTYSINMQLDEEEGDFVLFNIQGQGYYRVNYDGELWDRIIEALEDPEQREMIHPLNRGTLVDDALNLARAGKLDYDIAFRVVLSMEHETEYAVWKAFVRNMNFIRKRLVAFVEDDEDLDPDIYLRMVRRTIGQFEEEIGFTPDPLLNEPAMDTLTRGLVMDHACRANYQPCIAAAVDWFFDPDSNDPAVNPDIPAEIRPAVYCAMVREGDNNAINALIDHLEVVENTYERVVILESLACSQDEGFIGSLLQDTITDEYGVEERSKIFAAVCESSYDNARIAMNFISMRTIEIRDMYGGSQKLEEVIGVLADNMAGDLDFDFQVWVNSINSNLDDSADLAERYRDLVNENAQWDANHRDYVYEWIDENDAPTLVVSLFLMCIAFAVTLFNH